MVSVNLHAKYVLDLWGEHVTGSASGETAHKGIWQVHGQKS